MRILIVGGTGLISSAFAEHCLARGDDLTLVTRGRTSVAPSLAAAHLLRADATDAAALRSLLRGARLRKERWDAVLQFVAYTPDHVRDDVATFSGLTDRYVLVATSAAYSKAEHFQTLTESTTLANTAWEYAALKIECEQALREAAAPAGLGFTIVRPAHTYGDSKIPAFTGNSRHPWTLIDRMRRGADIVIPGDGTALWTVTHASDVATAMRGLLEADDSLGRAVHVTSREALTWTGIYRTIAHAAGMSDEQFTSQAVYVPSEAIMAAAPDQTGSIAGDKMHCAVYDTSLIESLVPGWSAQVSFADGVARAVAAFEANPSWQSVDDAWNARFDRLGAIYRAALSDAAALRT